MNHNIDELLDIIYRHYPRGIGTHHQLDTSRIKETEEHARLVAARRRAAADKRWRAMRDRISERFPDAPLMNHSLHLPTGSMDACYTLTIDLPNATTEGPRLWFHISFLVPYYLIHGYRLIEIVGHPEHFNVIYHGIHFFVKRGAVDPGFLSNIEEVRSKGVTVEHRDVTFDLSPDERPYAEWIAREIEATFGCERMPPEVGTVLVPDVATIRRTLGEARLYDCLFTDDHEWVTPPLSDLRSNTMKVDASHLTGPFTAVLTVQAALFYIMWALIEPSLQRGYWVVTTDGVLRKDEILEGLAKMRLHVETPTTLRAMVAVREIEALIAPWDGDGAPSDAMVAWASSFLASWDVGENGGSLDG